MYAQQSIPHRRTEDCPSYMPVDPVTGLLCHAKTVIQPCLQSPQQRMSMPPPSPGHQYPTLTRSVKSSTSSRPSPVLSSFSANMRVNMQHPSRQDSANSTNSAWDERLKTPRETWPETPREHQMAELILRSPVEEQFDHLLVGHAACFRILVTLFRNHCKFPHRFERNSSLYPLMSSHPYFPPMLHPTLPSSRLSVSPSRPRKRRR